ncbi:hypothetical protein, partial [Lacticaseibacillus rhamnosus]|uniref:hypothetical protein n=1 Tax=Lacticaseibacillus rhamnosus TaxID=47715 RepID=UPI001CDB3675
GLIDSLIGNCNLLARLFIELVLRFCHGTSSLSRYRKKELVHHDRSQSSGLRSHGNALSNNGNTALTACLFEVADWSWAC